MSQDTLYEIVVNEVASYKKLKYVHQYSPTELMSQVVKALRRKLP